MANHRLTDMWRVLVIKQSSLGDVLHSTAQLSRIKAHRADVHLTVLTFHNARSILQNNPDIDELICIDRDAWRRRWSSERWQVCKEFIDVFRLLRRQPFDLAIDLQGLGRSMIFLYACKAKRKLSKGKWLGVGGFRNKEMHALDELEKVVDAAGIKPSPETPRMRMCYTEQDQNAVRTLLANIASSKPILLISPYTRWPSKDWPLANFIAAGKALCAEYTVLISGTDGQESAKIAAELGRQDLLEADVHNIAGVLPLAAFAALQSHVAVVLTGDSFPMHLAAANERPLVALFAPTYVERVGPRAPIQRIIKAPDCITCDNRHCQVGCIKRIKVDDVVAELREMVSTIDHIESCSEQEPRTAL